MRLKSKYRYWGLLLALMVLAITSIVSPDTAENVARAFILLLGAW